jgi:EAL domain-containing protein (putative c-di-GMP-specific phosphodiesterase class I)
LPPDSFIALAERAGLGGFLTEDVTIRALTDLAALPPEVPLPRIGINFPLDVLLVRETLARLDAAREVAGLSADRVIVELTESRPVDDVHALRRAAERLRQNGYQLAVDDVGPSVADHLRLLDLPFTSMKLDKDLVRQSATRPQARQFVERAIADGKARGLTVVAEGVETPDIWHAMQAAGADMAQGFLISRALPVGALPAWAEGWHRRRNFP